MNRMRLVASTLTALSLLTAIGCSAESDADATDESEINVDQAPVATGLTELRAGQAYLPGVDESPLAIGSGCLAGPKVSLTGGDVTATANVVQSRSHLGRELGLDLSGIPIPVGPVPGLSASAGLAVSTTFDSQSAVILFQASGKYESVVTGADAMPDFDATKVSECGYGYIARASHRVGAALVVTVRSSDKSKSVKGNVGGGAGTAAVKANIGSLIEQGSLELSLRFAADPIPGLPPAPFGDAVLAVGNTPEDKAQARQKLESALGWLGNAQSAISNYLLELRSKPDTAPPAPTQTINFKFYPGTPSSLRTAITVAAKGAADNRHALASAIATETTWTAFAKDAADGLAHRWNIPAALAKSTDELVSKQRDLLETNGGRIKKYEDAIGVQLDRCSDAIRNDAGKPEADLVAALRDDCKPPPAIPFDVKQFDVRPIAAISVDEVKEADRACPAGQRLPFKREANIFMAWSQQYSRATKNGLWTEDDGCNFSTAWLIDGKADCSPTFGTLTGLRICLSASGDPLAAP